MPKFKIKWFTREYKATFYMKSGNIITVGNIEEFKVEHRHGKVISFNFVWRLTSLAPGAFQIDLEQVEALIIQ